MPEQRNLANSSGDFPESHNPETPAVRCRGLAKTYGAGRAAVPALRGVDLEVREGEFLMLVGPSGSGKTTLISILSGVLDQDAGQCDVLGRDLHSMTESDRARFRGRSIGFVFQGFNLLPALTASENVAVPLLIQREPRKSALKKAKRMLELVELGARGDALPGQLSGGQQQRVAIARALIHEPRLIVGDEPTSNLDHKTGHDMMSVLRELGRQEKRTVIIVTHDTRIVEFADRVARMEDGRIVKVGTAMEAAQLL